MNFDSMNTHSSQASNLHSPGDQDWLRESRRLNPEQIPMANSKETLPSTPLDMEQQFDLITSKVNEAVKSLNMTYNEIGYSSKEIGEKKTKIFEAINNTIESFKTNLQREKNSISNECEWLRQQIRIILAMLGDNTGEKHLRLSSRGVVFKNDRMYAEGCKEDISQHMSKRNTNKQSPSESFMLSDDSSDSPTTSLFPTKMRLGSPFGESHLTDKPGFKSCQSSQNSNEGKNENHIQDPVLSHNPQMSLLQHKSRLNSVFLEVLKAFVKVFRDFNEINRILWENIELITEERTTGCPTNIVSAIPDKAEAEEHAILIAEFDSIIEHLNLRNRNYKPELRHGLSDEISENAAFIISSPRKRRQSALSPQSSPKNSEPSDDAMDRLREINYKLVHAIRGLKVTKITTEVISELSKEVEKTEQEICARTASMKNYIAKCLRLIEALSLTESDLMVIQKMQDQSERESNTSSGEGLFDIDTLKFIQTNPREFGLMDQHLQFVAKLAHTLQRIKDGKQKKWDHYSQACVELWEKLGENKNYTEQFLSENASLKDSAITNLKVELKRLYSKRAEYVDSFILDARNQISQLQEKLLYSEERCREFKFHDYDVNAESGDKEQILNEHEAEIARLKADYCSKEPVLSLYAQLTGLLEDQKFLAESSKDSSRLLSKNSCKILLNEEKLRKKISKNLPPVLTMLKREIISYNDKQLSQGLPTITAGNDDMFEKVVSIESSSNVCGNKQARSKASPHKSRSVTSTRSSSPTKVCQSPSRVQKQTHMRKSPAFASTGQTKSRISQKTMLPRSRLSPSQRPDTGSRKTSPTNSIIGDNIRDSRINVLRPLTMSLAPENSLSRASSPGGRSDLNTSSSTLYSMCPRVSPLRTAQSDNRSFLSSLSPHKLSGKSSVQNGNEDDKENAFVRLKEKFGGPLVNESHPTRQNDEHTRLSRDSLANSTIVGEDYQNWREERIKQINGDDLDLC
ncbi:hypothetical protein OXX79_004599 [Metschnikowia pulcherrima]